MSAGWKRVAIGTALVVAVAAPFAASGLAGATSAPAPATHAHHEASAGTIVSSRRAFHDAMRKLWEDHITWTRLFIVSFAADLPDLDATTARLLKNQVDIGQAIVPFYGEAAGDRLTELLTDHILTAADLLAAAKAGDEDAFSEAQDAWYRNARQIARFLSEANPENWSLEDLKAMMFEHLDLTLAEAAHQLGGDYEQSVQDYDAVHASILHMADMLSRGIFKQFPGRFG